MFARWIHHKLNNLPAKHFRWILNTWPPFFGAGISVKKIAADYKSVDVILKMHWYNKNYVGTHFGGSMFSMTDPFYMLILLKNLGPDYIIWDKAASIDFQHIGKGTLTAHFEFSDIEIAAIKQQADQNPKYVFTKPVTILNSDGIVVATVQRTLYVRRKDAKTYQDGDSSLRSE